MNKIRKALIASLFCAMSLSLVGAVACGNNEGGNKTKPDKGSITGVVTDGKDVISDADVFYYISSDEDDDPVSVTPDEDGKYEIKGVAVGNLTLNAEALGYTSWTKDITEADFDYDGVANVDIIMQEGLGTITGTVGMKGHTNIKLKDVEVKVQGTTITATTDDNGAFRLEEVPMLATKTLQFSRDGYKAATQTVTKRSYNKNGVYNITSQINLDQKPIDELAGFKPYGLSRDPIDSTKLNINFEEIDSYFDQSSEAVSGKIDAHSEGLCLNADTSATPTSKDLAAFITTKIKVDENHQWITVNAATFENQNNESGVPGDLGYRAKLGLYVFHAKGTGTKVSDTDYELDTSSYDFTLIETYNPIFQPVQFDLRKYNGQEITLVLGTQEGYHCVIQSIKFSSEKINYVVPVGVAGLAPLQTNVSDKNSFDADSLKSDWIMAGAASSVDQGFMLNSKDPWKAWHFDDARNTDKSVNSYIYVTKNITDATSMLTYKATLHDIEQCLDPGNADDKGPYYPYLKALAIAADGTVVAQTDWLCPWLGLAINDETKKADHTKEFTLDLSGAVGQQVTIVIACNVGYKATITNVEFNDGTQAPDSDLEALPPESNDED